MFEPIIAVIISMFITINICISAYLLGYFIVAMPVLIYRQIRTKWYEGKQESLG